MIALSPTNQPGKLAAPRHASTASAGSKGGEILTTEQDLVPTGVATVDWQTAMRRAIRSESELRRRLGLAASGAGEAAEGDTAGIPPPELPVPEFSTFVPLEFLSRIAPGDPHDPLLRQVLPSPEERVDEAGFVSDPVGDLDSLASGGVLFKYEGRALLISTAACGVHCRYCFRREFPYQDVGSRGTNWRPAIEFVRSRRDIDEVLLSGGDPLTLVDETLAELVAAIASIGHVRRLRIHSRMPVVIPQRVTPRLIEILAETRPAVWFVIHANHPRELDAAVLESLGRLIDRGIPVLNQAVLLRGVNDDAETLTELSRRLVDHRVQPYYLHQLDRVRGASHFEVSQSRGQRLMAALRDRLPGYAVPTYVREQAGAPSKTPLPLAATAERSPADHPSADDPPTQPSDGEPPRTG